MQSTRHTISVIAFSRQYEYRHKLVQGEIRKCREAERGQWWIQDFRRVVLQGVWGRENPPSRSRDRATLSWRVSFNYTLFAGAREVRVRGSIDPLKFETGVKKLIPRLCRTHDFWSWPPCWKMVPARLVNVAFWTSCNINLRCRVYTANSDYSRVS